MNRDRFPICEKEVPNRVSAGKRLSVINPATGKQLAAVPYLDRAPLVPAASGLKISSFCSRSLEVTEILSMPARSLALLRLVFMIRDSGLK
jgi:hypothetical protein